MAQIGLADTLKLLAAGYKKKDIEALASIDETPEDAGKQDPAPVKNDPAPAQGDPKPEVKKDIAEDLRKELEAKQAEADALEKQLKEYEEKIKKIQQDNVHKDAGPAAAEAKANEAKALTDLVRSFM